MVEDLLKLFLTTRSSHNNQILRQLFTDFPTNDPAVRIVLLMTVFTNPDGGSVNASTVRSRLDSLKLGPITRVDICNVFINPYLERYNALLEYLRTDIQNGDDGQKGMTPEEIRAVVEDVAVRCLELECKVCCHHTTPCLITCTGKNAEKTSRRLSDSSSSRRASSSD